jgi:aspartyl-tRNA(Asn)/glutamyl-tRNA(Gln) amidotransferase subunit C
MSILPAEDGGMSMLASPVMAETLTRETVERVARLARLELREDELDLFTRQLTDILRYAEQIQTVDTAGIPPMSHALASDTAWRADVVEPSLTRDEALGQAPEADRAAGVFRVPKVIG